MWLRVEDEDIHEAKQLRVTMSAVKDGKGKKKRRRYQYKVILHGSSKEKPVAGFSALPAFVAGVTANSTWAVVAAEDSRSSEGRHWLARIIEEQYQNPQDFIYCGEQFGKGYYTAKITGTGASGVGSSGRTKKKVGASGCSGAPLTLGSTGRLPRS